jgi:hypothetical protein
MGVASSTPAVVASPSASTAQDPCDCEHCWRKANRWRLGPFAQRWADLYLPPLPSFSGRSMPQPRALCSKADVRHALEALCDGSTPAEWRLALGRELVTARLCMDKGEQHFEEAGVSERVEDLLEVGAIILSTASLHAPFLYSRCIITYRLSSP